MENQNKEVNKYLVINEKDFDKKYYELLNYCQMVKGYFRTEDISHYLATLNPTEYEHSNQVISGFYASLTLFSDNIENLFENLQGSFKELKTHYSN